MGVPGLYRSIINKYPSTHYWKDDEKIDYFYMDFNTIIYGCLKVLEDKYKKVYEKPYGEICKLLIQEIINKTQHMVCDVIKPKKLLFIAIDGPAPKCKIIKQRERRYKYSYDTKIKNEIMKKYGVINVSNWTNIFITPGTDFMHQLNNAMETAIVSGIFGAKISIIFSDCYTPGEGEHKLMQHISQEKIDENDTICIYSNDGDLLILPNKLSVNKSSDNKLSTTNILILSDPNKNIDIINDTYPDNEFVYFSLSEFQKAFVEEIGLSDYNAERIILDYMLFTMFGGNDFVQPIMHLKMRYSGTFDNLCEIYKQLLEKHKKHLILISSDKKYIINHEFLLEYISILAMNECRNINQYFERIENYSFENQEEEAKNWQEEYDQFQHKYYYDRSHPDYYKYIDDFTGFGKYTKKNKYKWRTQYYEILFNFVSPVKIDHLNYLECDEYAQHCELRRYQSVMPKIDNVCKDYLKSLVFTFKYYCEDLPSWKWAYEYQVAPLPTDLHRYLTKLGNINKLKNFNMANPYEPFMQMLMNLPPSLPQKYKRYLLPREYDWIMNESHSSVKWMYPNTYEINAIWGEKYIYADPKLPRINEKILYEIYKQIKIDDSKKNRNKIGKAAIYSPV